MAHAQLPFPGSCGRLWLSLQLRLLPLELPQLTSVLLRVSSSPAQPGLGQGAMLGQSWGEGGSRGGNHNASSLGSVGDTGGLASCPHWGLNKNLVVSSGLGVNVGIRAGPVPISVWCALFGGRGS